MSLVCYTFITIWRQIPSASSALRPAGLRLRSPVAPDRCSCYWLPFFGSAFSPSVDSRRVSPVSRFSKRTAVVFAACASPRIFLYYHSSVGKAPGIFFCLFINFLYSIFSENSSCRIELLYPYISGKMSSPQQRLSSIANQLSGPGSAAAKQQILSKNPDDIVSIFAHDAMKLASDANACQ